jgi:hypothetical protein
LVIFTPLEKPQGSTTKVMKKNKQTVLQEAARIAREEKRRLKKDEKTSHQLEMARVARQAQANIKKSSKVTPSARRDKPLEKVIAKSVLLNPSSDLAKWARMLSRPFDFEGYFCPINYNPVPSFIQSTARTTSTNLNFTVGTASGVQMVLFPGHGQIADSVGSVMQGAAAMDGVAYHGMDQVIGNAVAPASHYVPGPMNKTDNISTKVAVAGFVTTTALNVTAAASNTASSSALTWDVSLPYVSVTNGTNVAGHHSRWQLTAMGIRIHNVSPEIYRGGTVITVQPTNNYHPGAATSLNLLEAFPTFKDHGVGEDVEVSWIPRAEDLAFWHGADSEVTGHADPYIRNPGMLIFFENATGSTQSYTYEVVCHWQLSGTYLNPVGGPAPHAPEVKPAVEKTLSFLQNNSHTARQAVDIVSKAVSHSGATSNSTWADFASRGFSAARSAAEFVASSL